MEVVGRYAPSPTGYLHLGNLRTALIAWLAARLDGGRFLIRVEDNDGPRVQPEREAEQLSDLEALGLDWDGEIVRQSEREEIYAEHLARLEEAGLLFWCTCSRKDIEASASAPHGPKGPSYPGTCRGMEKSDQLAHPNGAACRLRVPDDDGALLAFGDELLGEQLGNLRQLGGDIVIQRRDRLWAYQFACAVDDALQGITQVVRGADLVSSTFKQLYIQQQLGLASPREWWHVPLLISPDGNRLAKRDESLSLRNLIASEWRAEDVVGWLAVSLGIHPNCEKSQAPIPWPSPLEKPRIPAISTPEILSSLTREKLLIACCSASVAMRFNGTID